MDDKTDSLVQAYGTRDPFELVEKLDVFLDYEPLGNSVNGFYYAKDDIKLIVLNSQTPRHIQRFTCCHELAHHILHTNTNALLLSVQNRQEYEADKFAMYLLLPEEDLKEYPERTIDDWASILGLPRETVALRF